MTFKYVPLSDTLGRPIPRVHDAGDRWHEWASSSQMPGADRMQTFALEFGKRVILALDDYGNDWVLPEVEQRIVGKECADAGYLVGVDLKSGVLHIVTFARFDAAPDELHAVVIPFGDVVSPTDSGDDAVYRVPKKFLKPEYVRKLRSAKRPWRLRADGHAAQMLLFREIGWPEFVKNISVELDIGAGLLEVRAGMCRVLGVWE